SVPEPSSLIVTLLSIPTQDMMKIEAVQRMTIFRMNPSSGHYSEFMPELPVEHPARDYPFGEYESTRSANTPHAVRRAHQLCQLRRERPPCRPTHPCTR